MEASEIRIEFEDLSDYKNADALLDQYSSVTISMPNKVANHLKAKIEKYLDYSAANSLDKAAVTTVAKAFRWLASEIRYPSLAVVDMIVGERNDIKFKYINVENGKTDVQIYRIGI